MTGQALTGTTPTRLPQVIGASRQLSIASTLGDEIVRKRWVAFLKRLESAAAHTIISKWQPLDEESIELFKDSLNWGLLSENEALPWTQDLINRFVDRWDWGHNSYPYYFDPSILSLEEVLEIEYMGKGLSANAMLPWSTDFIEKFERHLGFRIVLDNQQASPALAVLMPDIFINATHSVWEDISSRSLPWSVDLIERCKELLDWEPTCYIGWVRGDPYNVDSITTTGSFSRNEAIPWSLDLIDQFKDRWDWVGLLCNRAVPWPVESIESLGRVLSTGVGNNPDPVDFGFWPESLIKRLAAFAHSADSDDSDDKLDILAKVRHGISRNMAIEWSSDLIDRNLALWDWGSLSANAALPWLPVLIKRYEDRWDWRALSSNVGLPWSLDLIERYEDLWDWETLSSNVGLPWSFDLIERYEDLWDWKTLSSNVGLPWSLDLIERYEDRWDWKALSSNTGLPWSKELVALHEDHWDWDRLSCNEALPWSLDLIERFESRWNYYSLTGLSGALLAMPSLKLSELAEVLGHFDPGPKSATFLGNDE